MGSNPVFIRNSFSTHALREAAVLLPIDWSHSLRDLIIAYPGL